MTAVSEAAPVERPPYAGTRLHAMRIPDDIWQAARDRADADGSSVNAEVRAFLAAYAAGERFTLKRRD